MLLSRAIGTDVKALQDSVGESLHGISEHLRSQSDQITALTTEVQKIQLSSHMFLNINVTDKSNLLQTSHQGSKTMSPFTRPMPSQSALEKGEYVPVPATVYRSRQCGLNCRCSCHGGSSFRTPRWLNVATGDLSLVISGCPMWSQRSCNDEACSQRGKRLIRLTYYFPLWALQRMISFTNASGSFGDHTIFIKTARIISPSADVFAFAQQGYIDGLRDLFANRRASPFDVSGVNGRSALNVSLCINAVKSCI